MSGAVRKLDDNAIRRIQSNPKNRIYENKNKDRLGPRLPIAQVRTIAEFILRRYNRLRLHHPKASDERIRGVILTELNAQKPVGVPQGTPADKEYNWFFQDYKHLCEMLAGRRYPAHIKRCAWELVELRASVDDGKQSSKTAEKRVSEIQRLLGEFVRAETEEESNNWDEVKARREIEEKRLFDIERAIEADEKEGKVTLISLGEEPIISVEKKKQSLPGPVAIPCRQSKRFEIRKAKKAARKTATATYESDENSEVAAVGAPAVASPPSSSVVVPSSSSEPAGSLSSESAVALL